MSRIAKTPVGLLAILGLALAASPALAQEAWPTTHFEVFFGIPKHPDDSERPRQIEVLPLTEAELDGISISPSQLLELEDYLHKAAEQLVKWRFPPPRLPVHDPVIPSDSGPSKVYRVYVYPYGNYGNEGYGEYESLSCARTPYSQRFDYFSINADHWKPAGSSGEQAQLLHRPALNGAMLIAGHELFHAVQGATAAELGTSCELPDWVDEGTADAVGYDLFRLIKGRRAIFPTDLADADLVHGLRRYFIPLDFEDDKKHELEDYQTSSFWRYLAERAAAGNQLPGPDWERPDYTYLAELYADPDVPEKPEGLLREWLQFNLKKGSQIGVGLDRVLADFHSVFAAFPDYRAKGHDKLIWLNTHCKFNGDRILVLESLSRYVEMTADLAPRSSICFLVERDDFLASKPLTITITVEAASKAQANDLSLGESGGDRVMHGSPSAGCNDSGGECKVSWAWLLEPDAPKLFVLTAVRPEEPEKTPENKGLSISITTGGFDVNLSDAPDAKVKSRRRSGDGPVNAREAMEHGALDLRQDGAFTAALSRPDDIEDRFIISAKTTPGYADVIASTFGVGGLFQQAFADGALYDEFYTEIMAAEILMERDLESRDGAEFRIEIPPIDYGFKGTIENALIFVSKAGGGDMLSQGPRDTDPSIYLTSFPASGSVTIDTYTPDMLRGSFSGNLVDYYSREQMLEDRKRRIRLPTLPIVRRVQGRFWISAPWQLDERYVSIVEDGAMSRFSDEMSQLMRGMFRYANGQRGPSEPSDEAIDIINEAMGGGGAGGAIPGMPGNCKCTCEEYAELESLFEKLENPDPDDLDAYMALSQQMMTKSACAMTCREEYDACE